MLEQVPGTYINIGTWAEGEHGGCQLHNPLYDFNDAIISLGSGLFSTLVERQIPRGTL